MLYKITRSLCVLFASSAMMFSATTHAESVSLSVGDKAPTFEVSDDQGKPWKSSEHFGKKIVVVYFYPADMTGGCTAQACAFRDDLGKLAGKDVAVVRRR